MNTHLPPVEREYIEIYPVHWTPFNEDDVRRIMSSRSHEPIRELTLYCHIPFCPELCEFCSFNKTAYRESIYESYVTALINEVECYRHHPDLNGRVVTAVYFGGGTGSMLTPADLTRVMDKLAGVFTLSDGCEFTVESHPSTLVPEKLDLYAKAGVNRLSIGIQSFVDRKLQSIRRSHTAAQNERVIQDAKAVGIDKLSIDLMYRLPHETMDELNIDLEKVIEFQPTNVSCYSLIVEGTNFARALPTLPAVNIESEMLTCIRETLMGNGYEQWSIADFCHPGGTTQYNMNYWRAPQTLLLGFGAGAHTHYFGGHTWANTYSVLDYIEAISNGRFAGITGQAVCVEELMRRYMVLGVHCLTVEISPFRSLFDTDLQDFFDQEIEQMTSYDWIRSTDGRIEVTRLGQLYINNVAQGFFSPVCRSDVQPWSKALRRMRPSEYVLIERGGLP